jgi:predicted MFS family arabinose efflux permease
MLRWLLLAQLVSTCGRGVFLAVTAIYFTQVVGLGTPAVGLGLTAAGAVGVVGSYAFGRLADRLSARRLMTWALVGEGLALLGLAWATTWITFVLFAAVEFGLNRGGFTARQTRCRRMAARESPIRASSVIASASGGTRRRTHIQVAARRRSGG